MTKTAETGVDTVYSIDFSGSQSCKAAQDLNDIQMCMSLQRDSGSYLGYFMARKVNAVVVKF